MKLSDAKHIAVGLLFALLFPVWLPLLVVAMFIDLLRTMGRDICERISKETME